jgi:glycosyltransferase involved in cell wall biosynthesis
MPLAADPGVFPPVKRHFASVIIAVYNDWPPLARCLQSLAEQTKAPSFEVIVVDDGSTKNAPASILEWTGGYPWKIVRQPHLGTAAARNQGIRHSAGEILLFIDADSIPQNDCLAALAQHIAASPARNYFQLCLAGIRSTLAGRAEDLRLIATQDFLLQPDGSIPYLNTAGFAVRRSCVDAEKGLFDERALRAEDTLLLANLKRSNQLPLFVPSAVVRHATDLSVPECLRKAVRSALLEARTHAIIATLGVDVLMNHRKRFGMLRSIWRISKTKSIGRGACILLVARQILRLVTLTVCRILPGRKPGATIAADFRQV